MQTRTCWLFASFIVCALAACGGVHSSPPADAAPIEVDAAIDSPPAPPTGSTRLDLNAGGRMSGGTLVVDVELGAPLAPRPSSGGTLTVTPAPPFVP